MSAEASRKQRQRRGQGLRRRARQERRRRSRIRVLLAVLVPAALVCAAVLAAPLWTGGDDLPAAAAESGPDGSTGGAPASSPGPDSTSGASPGKSAKTEPAPKASPRAKPKASHSTTIPASGPGTFTVARAGVTSGGGNAYRVEVEDGTGVDPDKAAAQVAGILAAPRGWAHGGAHTFHQVSGGTAGLVVRIATAATTDRICGQSRLDTHGEDNCRVGVDVMVNLK
ncbi:DUF3152 domain-containing protein, partial [Streptomyces sp. NPDC058221]|uniref:DUF3152 domain-containing protein n=1 Tax=Streptomyces sp. NPDC058221 TaxID=3346388 RepID=UPI0036EC2010